jgi:VWFA-related protein
LPDDALVEVMSFNDYADVLYPMGSKDQHAALSLAGVSPAGGTALYEAILVAMRGQQRAVLPRHGNYRQVIVVLTDGENTAGRVAFDDLLDDARRSSIVVYPVVLPPHDAPTSGPPWRMTQLALDTGGKTVAVHHTDDLTNIYRQIATDVRNLYRVGYVPSQGMRDGSWHVVQVRALSGDIVLRTRAGYYAGE